MPVNCRMDSKRSIWHCALAVLVKIQLASLIAAGAAESSSSKSSIIVIGGGVAGIAASTRLRSLGYNVTLLEAASRLGGRIHTMELGTGNYVEMGAEWIVGETGNSIFELMNPHGVLVSDEHWGKGYIFSNQLGEIMDKKFGEGTFNLFESIDAGNKSVGLSVGQVARTTFEEFIKDPKNRFHERLCAEYTALDWCHRASVADSAADDWFEAASLLDYVYNPGNIAVRWKRPYTYSTLIGYLLRQKITESPVIPTPEWAKLEKQVVSIRKPDNQVHVDCKDGATYSADHVISTVSLGYLKSTDELLTHLSLSAAKKSAIQNLGFGQVNKIYLEFHTPFWESNFINNDMEHFGGLQFLWEEPASTCTVSGSNESTLNKNWARDATPDDLLREEDGIPIWCRSILSFNVVRTHPSALQGFITGNAARLMETLDPALVRRSVMNLFRKFGSKLFTVIPEPRSVVRTQWYTNPLTRGAYSYRSVQSEMEHVFVDDLAAPVLDEAGKPVICFAGEATNRHSHSTVHGAYDSGIREADRIHAFYTSGSTKIGSEIMTIIGIFGWIVCQIY